jgi:hypothetical protein
MIAGSIQWRRSVYHIAAKKEREREGEREGVRERICQDPNVIFTGPPPMT